MEKSCGSFAIGISVIKLVWGSRLTSASVLVKVAAEAAHVHNSLYTYILKYIPEDQKVLKLNKVLLDSDISKTFFLQEIISN